jgi:trehalose 6-phosphate synthase
LSRLIVVSNRVAMPSGQKSNAGGLAVALQEALAKYGGVWFGWSGKVAAKTSGRPSLVESGRITYATLDLSRKDYREYYSDFANRTLWPLFHYRIDLTIFDRQDYSGYQRVNALFASKLMRLLKPDDMTWVHDYHLIPLGQELRRAHWNGPIGFFLHIPWPAVEILTTLPAHRQLVTDLCAYDVIGFQTQDDVRAFLDYIVHEADGRILGDRLIHAFGRTVHVDAFPIGIDTEEFERAGLQSSQSHIVQRMRAAPGTPDWILGVDRLDYSKGLVERMLAFERLLEKYSAYRGHVALIQIAPPSRSEVPEYKDIRRELETVAGHINGRFAEFDWVPINYLNKSYNRNDLAGFYRSSRIGLVTPLRDGMNLVAKEYVAAQNPHDPGVLVLSRFAGAARELDGALIVNPYDTDGVADAIAKGLSMPMGERMERWGTMINVLRTNTLDAWRDRFLEVLAAAPYNGD